MKCFKHCASRSLVVSVVILDSPDEKCKGSLVFKISKSTMCWARIVSSNIALVRYNSYLITRHLEHSRTSMHVIFLDMTHFKFDSFVTQCEDMMHY